MPLTTFMSVLLKRPCVHMSGGAAQMCSTVQTMRTPRTGDTRVTVAQRHWEMNNLEEGRRRVQVRKFKDSPTVIDIRMWFTKQKDGKDKRSLKGVEMTIDEFKKLMENSKEILEFIKSP